MKQRVIAMLTMLALLAGLVPAALAAGGAEEVRWLLPEELLVAALGEDALSSGGLAPEEGALDFSGGEGEISGTRRILVAPVRFAGEEEFLDQCPEEYGGLSVRELIDLSYSGTDVSVATYYDQVSFGALEMQPVWLLEEGGSLELPHGRDYYSPLSLENEEGYLLHLRAVRIYAAGGGRTDEVVYVPELACHQTGDRAEEHVLVDEDSGELLALCCHMDVQACRRSNGRLELVWRGGMSDDHSWEDSGCFYTEDFIQRGEEFRAEVYAAINASAVRQGIRDIDCATLWFSGGADDWGSLLWPHQDAFQAYGVSLYRSGGNKTYIALMTEYTLAEQIPGTTEEGVSLYLPETGTLAHELGHTLGFPDYYSYYNQTDINLGFWSLMDQTASTPQSIHGWASYIYGGWLQEDNVREITQEGRYTITTLSGATRQERDDGAVYLYYLQNPAGDPAYPERVVLEYRSPRGAFDGELYRDGLMPFPGLLLYSVDAEAERQLAGNISATGLDGRYGARLYTVEGIGGQLFQGYAESGPELQRLYDTMASALSDTVRPLKKGGVVAARTGYGSPDPAAAENAIVSRRTGKNSGIVICNAAIDPEDGTRLSFWVDLTAPAVEDVTDDSRVGVRTVTLVYDEPVAAGPGLAKLATETGAVKAQVAGNMLTLTLTGAAEGTTLRVPEDAVVDQAGRSMEEEVVLALPAAEQHAVFTDVSGDHWALAAITGAADAGLLRGVGGGRFAPEGTVNRGMLAAVLGRLAGADPAAGETDFADVPPEAWYAPYVAWATEQGLMTGAEAGRFAPEASVTREELAMVLARYLAWSGYALPEAEVSPYADEADIRAEALEAVYALRAAGVMGGHGGLFVPAGAVTRAQLAQVLYRCLALEG